MKIIIHPHAKERMQERGALEKEVEDTIMQGEQFPAKFGRVGFRRNFVFKSKRAEKFYETKQIEAYAVKEKNVWIVITVITRYF
ncbi:hypothetical protein MNBD_UNCLBAC01-1685 [hydrothermal vent metagenome]|uniref:DUF4258 domain-containing protein n=1 Tax=hydrothermal vent metagenome TaxID=652676 RepID=A0A3B1E0X2_9ZZZZ